MCSVFEDVDGNQNPGGVPCVTGGKRLSRELVEGTRSGPSTNPPACVLVSLLIANDTRKWQNLCVGRTWAMGKQVSMSGDLESRALQELKRKGTRKSELSVLKYGQRQGLALQVTRYLEAQTWHW